jgi:hypothetical protein
LSGTTTAGEARRNANVQNTFRTLQTATPYFPYIEIPRLFTLNVSSRPSRRNNLAAHETIFPFSCRRPETLAH